MKEMKHLSKIIALSLALLLTAMAAVPSVNPVAGFSFAGSEEAMQSDEKTTAEGKDVAAADEDQKADAETSAKDSDADQNAGPSKADADKTAGSDSDGKDTAGSKDKKTSADSIEFKGKEFDVTIESNPKAGLPADTKLSVDEITAKDKEYKDYYEKAVKAVQDDADKDKDLSKDQSRSVRFVRFYDMTLTAGSSDGEALEPEANVDVTIDYSKALKKGTAEAAEDADNVKIIHFTENEKTGKIEAEILDKDATKATVSDDSALTEAKFEAESFSVYAVVYTVDFHYGDGEYDFSIAGESSIMLSEVIERLHMDDLTISDVKDAKFGDSELVKVEKIKDGYDRASASDDNDKADTDNGIAPTDDWKLTSLKPFDTDETLTLTLNDGSKVEIRVTDTASASEFVPIANNSVITNAVGNSKFPVYYAFNNGAIVSGEDIHMPTELNSQRINSEATVVSAGADKTAFQSAWNAALGTNNVGVTVSRAWAENNTLQIQLAFTAANGHVYYSSQYGTTNSDNNTNQVRTEINNNRYMLTGEDKIVVRLTLANNNNAHFSKDGIVYGSTQNSVVKAFATSFDADTYGSNILPETVTIAGVPYTVVDNITTFKENNVTYSLDRSNLRATVTSGSTDAGTVNVNGTVFVIPRQNEYSGTVTYNGVTYTVDTSRTDGAPRADASAYKAATIGNGTNRTITYRTDYGQDTNTPTVVDNIKVSIPLSKTVQSTLSKEELLSELGDKSLIFGITEGSANPEGGVAVSLSDGESGTDYTLTYSDLLTNGTNTGTDTNTVYTLDGTDSPWEAVFTKEGTYTFTVSEKETGHTGVSNQSEAVTLTYYIVEEEGSLRLAEVYKAKDAEVASTKVSEANLENLDLTKLFNTSFALGSAGARKPDITASGETITMKLNPDTSGVITTKFTFDFSRSFEIKGQLGTPDSDAVAIAFHGYDALPAYRWDCNNGFDDFHYGNGDKRQELRFLRYGYIPPNGDLKKAFYIIY